MVIEELRVNHFSLALMKMELSSSKMKSTASWMDSTLTMMVPLTTIGSSAALEVKWTQLDKLALTELSASLIEPTVAELLLVISESLMALKLTHKSFQVKLLKTKLSSNSLPTSATETTTVTLPDKNGMTTTLLSQPLFKVMSTLVN